MLSLKSVLDRSKNFTSDDPIRMPPTVPVDHYFGLGFGRKKTDEKRPRSCSVIPCWRVRGLPAGGARFEHSNLFEVNGPGLRPACPSPPASPPGARVPPVSGGGRRPGASAGGDGRGRDPCAEGGRPRRGARPLGRGVTPSARGRGGEPPVGCSGRGRPRRPPARPAPPKRNGGAGGRTARGKGGPPRSEGREAQYGPPRRGGRDRASGDCPEIQLRAFQLQQL